MIDMVATGENITRMRLEHDMTVKQLMKAVGLTSVQAVYKWENGNGVPSIDVLMRMSDVFGVSINDIIKTA